MASDPVRADDGAAAQRIADFLRVRSTQAPPMSLGEMLDIALAAHAPGYAVVRRPEYDTPLGCLFIVDVADEARRMFGAEAAAHIRGGPMPEHDYRLHMATPTGGRGTFSAGGTADEVMAWQARWDAEHATPPSEPEGRADG